jgi:SEC-C motif-containing protein
MRSRYAAFARRDAAYLMATWHPSTRPDSLDLDPAVLWQAREVLATEAGGPEDEVGQVEFRARFRHGIDAGQLHERSRFARRAGRWLYVDGDLT